MEDNKSPKLHLSMILAESEPVEMVERSIDYIYNYIDDAYITITYKGKKPSKSSGLYKLLKKKYNANVSFFKWVEDFAEARNFALDQIPKGKNHYFIWQDADDVWMNPELIPGVLRQAVTANLKAVFFPYWYQVELDDQGDIAQVLTEQKRERIVLNDGSFKWVAPLHETLIDQTQENSQKILLKEPIVVHMTNGERMDKNIDRNLKILKATHEKQNGQDPRTSIYLAKTYFDKAKSFFMDDKDKYKEYADLAIKFFGLYLDGSGQPGEKGYIPPSGWAEERSTAWNYVAEIALLSGAYEAAENALKSAIDESEKFPNYYVDLASVYIKMGKWDKAKHYLTIGTNMPKPNTTIVTTPRDFELRSLEATAQIALHEKDFKIAKKAVSKMVELVPDSKSLKERLTVLNSLLVFNQACQSAVFLGKYLEQIGEEDKIPHLINSFSKDMQTEKFAAEMRRLFTPPRTWAQNEITIVAGPGFEEWSPDSLETGLGGSEEAIVHMANELTKLGWYVTVYANPGAKAGNFNGVDYRMWYEFNPHDDFNVLVLWRGIGFADVKPKAKFTTLWLHDVPNNPDFTKDRIDFIDRIMVLSDFHKSLLMMNDNGVFKPIPEEKIWVSSNGIADLVPEEFNPRTNNRLIYASSPDRGLVHLLRNWERIKTEVPDATLDIYYGFDVFDAIHKNNPERLAWKAKMMQLMDQDGISYHGRVGHDELHRHYMEADIWAYPTHFEEISCISGMKAQALGAIPVVTDYAALSETVKNGIKVDIDITDPDDQQEYFDSLIKLMKDPARKAEIRKPMMKFAQNYFSWSKVAEEWSRVFSGKVRS